MPLWYNFATMLTNILLVLGGFLLLIKGADYLVDGSSSLARKLGVPSLVVGLTVMAFGTSAPELFVNVIAAVQGNSDIAIGNVLGSNLANILLILGVTAIVAPLKLKSSTVWKEIPFSLLAAIMLFVMGMDHVIDGAAAGSLSRIDGLVLWGFFLVFLVYTFGIRESGERPQQLVEQHSIPVSFLYVLGGLIGLVIGGQFVVNGASGIAYGFGITENLVALTIVAFGTSLPELVSSVMAAKKGHQDLAIGNVVGSNVFNILLVVSTTSIIRPLPFGDANVTDAFAVVTATLMLFFLLFVGKRQRLGRLEGSIFVMMYLGFVAFAIFRG